MESTNATIHSLNHWGLLMIEGDKAADFLQGQLTCDVTKITEEQGAFSGYCDYKGRLLALAEIVKTPSGFNLRLPLDILDITQQALQRVAMLSRVNVITPESSYKHLGLHDPERALAALLPLPNKDFAVAQHGKITLIALPHYRYALYGPELDMSALQESVLEQVKRSDENHWDCLAIKSGTPKLSEKTVAQFIPQRLNLQAYANSLSFDKGCYVGQEIIARLHHRGTLKHHLYRVQVATNTLPESGAGIYQAGKEQAVGHIVAAAQEAQAVVALAVIADNAAETDLALQDGTAVEQVTLVSNRRGQQM